MKSMAILCMSLVAISAQESGKVQTDSLNALVTPSSIVALSDTAAVAPAANRELEFDPGIRVSRLDTGLSLSTFDGKNIVMNSGTESVVLSSGTLICPTETGWNLGNGKISQTSRLHARRQAQDDADTNLKSMQEAAKKLSAKPAQPARKGRARWIYAENPLVTAELFDTPAIQQLSHLSAVGF